MPDRWIDDLLRPDRELHAMGNGIWSALSPGEATTPYDRHAAGYDRLVGNGLYNRLVWGASTASYTAFAAAAIDDGDGPLLDVGCGTLVFTGDAYAAASRPLVLVDRSGPRRPATEPRTRRPNRAGARGPLRLALSSTRISHRGLPRPAAPVR